jgi:RNA polymerase sigma-70 factor (ECF subfamily)
MLYRYFVRMTGSEDVGWDLVQETFLRMLKYRHSFRETGKFRSWTFQIAHNVWHDHYRKYEKEVSLDMMNRDFATPNVLPLAELEKAQEARMLHEALSALPTEKRELLVLSHFERMPYAEIAEVLSVSVGAVKVRVHRAVKELREAYLKRTRKRTDHES